MTLRVDTQLVSELGGEAAAARRIKEQGFDGAFTFEGPHDVFFPLVAAAGAGAGLDLMTNIAVALPRSPVHLAHAAWDLQVLSGGRFRLGLGSQVRPQIERRYGGSWVRPVAQMREWIGAVRAILAAWDSGEPVDFQGEFTRHTLMPPTFSPGRNPFGPPPILAGALGPQMTRMVASAADGLLVMPFNSRRHLLERTLPAVDAGLASAGRPARGSVGDRFELVAEVIVGCARDEREHIAATAGVRGLLAFYGSTPSYRPVLEVEGWGDVQTELNRLSKQGCWSEMATLVDDEMVSRLAVCGTPSECAQEILRRYGDVATRLAVYQPYAADPGSTADLLDALRAG